MKRLTLCAVSLAVLASVAPSAFAQTPAPTPPAPMDHMHMAPTPAGGHMSGTPTAAPADVATPEAVVKAYYEALSGPTGKKRDWNRYLSLFYHDARLLPAEGKGHSRTMPMSFTPQSYLYNSEPRMLEDGYVVQQIASRGESFGKIRHVWSTYEGRHAAADAKPFVRGINSFQLFFDGKRWWIFNVVWQPETTKLTLPAEDLK
ncbi:MAG TPA: hypothetical protein VFE33_21875 [Thermoanaerobaculia bacterium]|nr:hypothetical protein [Thermoanaerobaculia bacterium]